MKFEVQPVLLHHRGSRCLQRVHTHSQSTEGRINGAEFMLGQIEQRFWLVPVYESDEPLVDDIGPFDTPEQAYAQLRLRSA